MRLTFVDTGEAQKNLTEFSSKETQQKRYLQKE